MKSIPAMSRDLVEALDKEYPARCIGLTESAAEAHRRAGARDLVDYLIHLLARADARAEDQIL